jgi:thioesterase domain-containing protein
MLAHHPRTYPGHAVVVLHALDASAYTSDPERDWEALAETVDVVVLPGADHDMLKEPGVGRLAEILNGKPGTASGSPPPHRARR